jgi:SAM-dependent methyltransferase
VSLPAGLPGKVASCGLCGSWDLKPVLDMGEQPLPERYGSDERYPLALLECAVCTLIQLSYIAPPREVFAQDHSYSSGNTKALREHFAGLAREVARIAGPGQTVVDVGCNDGTLLEAVRREVPGQVVGVEPTGQAARASAKGIEVCQEFFGHAAGKRLRQVFGPAKVVTACNVLAHVPDPHSFIAGVARLLADDGVLIAEVHDVASVLDGLQIDAVYAEHNFYWSITTLSRLLGMHGLVVTDVEKIGTHGGSFRVTARRQKTRDLSWRAKALRGDLLRLLEIASEDGQIYGIGACTRATPLIHYTGMASYIACVCEVPGSDKIGMVMPGTSIRVVDEAKLIADQPSYAFLFAWHWADSIVPKLRAKGYEGKFIVPLPQARILPG